MDIIKSIRGHHTCLALVLRQDHRQLDKRVIAQIIQSIVKTNSIISIKTLMAEIKMFMNYTPSYKKTWLAKQKSVGDDSWKLGRIICQVAKTFESFAILYSRDCDGCPNRIRV